MAVLSSINGRMFMNPHNTSGMPATSRYDFHFPYYPDEKRINFIKDIYPELDIPGELEYAKIPWDYSHAKPDLDRKSVYAQFPVWGQYRITAKIDRKTRVERILWVNPFDTTEAMDLGTTVFQRLHTSGVLVEDCTDFSQVKPFPYGNHTYYVHTEPFPNENIKLHQEKIPRLTLDHSSALLSEEQHQLGHTIGSMVKFSLNPRLEYAIRKRLSEYTDNTSVLCIKEGLSILKKGINCRASISDAIKSFLKDKKDYLAYVENMLTDNALRNRTIGTMNVTDKTVFMGGGEELRISSADTVSRAYLPPILPDKNISYDFGSAARRIVTKQELYPPKEIKDEKQEIEHQKKIKAGIIDFALGYKQGVGTQKSMTYKDVFLAAEISILVELAFGLGYLKLSNSKHTASKTDLLDHLARQVSPEIARVKDARELFSRDIP